jgi:hypothetical protein
MTQKHTAANTVAEVPATERVDPDQVMSPGNPAEDGFIIMTLKNVI